MRMAIAAALVLAGCAARARSPQATLLAYAQAIEQQDPRAAYLLLAHDRRAQLSESEFAARFRAGTAELRVQARHLRQAALTGRLHERARVESAGRVSLLEREPAGWRVSVPGRIELGAQTPEEALRRFVQALEERSFDALLRLLAEPLRGAVERELAERLSRLKAALGKPIPLDADRARIRYDPRYHLDLLRENGQWRVADFN